MPYLVHDVCVCIQVSHALHLSAVSSSYYRFHVEHLQSDDYSKDKVRHKSPNNKYFTATISLMLKLLPF